MSGGGNAGGPRGAGNGFGMKMKGLLDGAGKPGWQFDKSGFRDAMGDFRSQLQDMRGDWRNQLQDMRGDFHDRAGDLRGQWQSSMQGQPGQSSVSVNVNGQDMPNGMNNVDLSQLQARLQGLGPDIQQRLMQGLAPLRRAGFPFS
jgi:hypothetical protein